MAAVFDRQMSPPGLPEPGAPSRVSSAGGNGTGLSEDTNNIKATIIQDIWIHLDSGSHMGETLRWSLTQFSGTSMKALGTPYFVVQSGFFQPFSNPKNGWKEFWIDMFFFLHYIPCCTQGAFFRWIQMLPPLAVSLRPGRARKASTSQARNWTKGSCRVEARPHLDVCGSACQKKQLWNRFN